MNRAGWLIALTAACLIAAILLPPIAQPLTYHDFADRREWYGIANCFDVISNGGFLIAGIVGLMVTFRHTTVFESDVERWPYAVCFLGMLLTAFGSGYYHLAPDNERLFWDRLPMTIAFMSLVAAQVVDRVSVRAGLIALVPMLAVGAASVLWWRITERAAAGNVTPYALLQAYSVVVLLVIAITHRARYTHGSAIYWVFGWYVLAKLLEYFDVSVFALGNILSGHTLKHLAAAAAGLTLCRMLAQRRLPVSGDFGREVRKL